MVDKKKSVKKESNKYKVMLFILIGVILVGALIFGMSKIHSQVKAEAYTQGTLFGQQNAINIILNEIQNKGFITITTQKGNISLVPTQAIGLGQEKIISQIVDSVNEKGFVSITQNDEELVLVPYTGATQ